MSFIEKFKRFSLHCCDLPSMVSNVDTLMKLLAVNIDPRRKQPVSVVQYVWLVFFVSCNIYVYWISMVWFVFWRCRESDDVTNRFIIFSLGVTSSVGINKLAGIFIYRKRIRNLISGYLLCDSKVVPGSRFSQNMNPTLRATKKRATIVWNVVVMNAVFYLLIPLLIPGTNMPEEDFDFLGIENMTEYPTYIMAFSINVLAVFGTAFPAACVIALFMVVTGYTEAQMLALSEEVRQLWNDAETEYYNCEEIDEIEDNNKKEKFIDVYVHYKLIDVLRIHITNLNLFLEVERLFQGTVAVEFMQLIVGLIAELFGGLENTYIQLPFTVMFVSIDCITGQKITNAGHVLEQAIYDSNWEKFSVQNMKMVLLMLKVSQRNLTLSAGGIADLSLECLMGVFKMIYSTYTTLRSTVQ